ncbi:MAG: hypothetical protein ABR613_08805 [Actinomycetota bacterium]
MSPDLHTLMHDAAPRPSREVDVVALSRRARRISVTRAATAAVAAAVVAAGGTVVARSFDGAEPTGVVSEPEEDRAALPPPRPHAGDRSHPPRGPRHEVLSGTHGDDWAEPWEGQTWRLLAWSKGHTICVQLAYRGQPRNQGLWCSHDQTRQTVRDTALGGSTSFFTGSEDPDEFYFVAGAVGPRVAELELRRRGAAPVAIPLHAAPEQVKVPYRYYAATLPRFDLAHLVALDAEGRALETSRICGPGCRAERGARLAAEIEAYEAQPVEPAAKAAVFAVSVAGQAGLIDEFGRRWSYRGLVATQDGFLARFDATRCTRRTPRPGQRACRPGPRTGTLRIAVEEDLFVVTGVTGPASGAERAAMLADEEEVPEDHRGWRLVAHAFARGGTARSWGVSFALAWTGNVPAPRGYTSTCWMNVYDGDGDLILRGPNLDFEAPAEESERVAGLTTEIETGVEPDHLGVACNPPTRQ